MATDSGGLPTVIEDGETGYLVPMRDSDAITGALNQLLSDQLEHGDIGRSVREYVELNRFWESLIEKLGHIYTECVDRNTAAD